jgi:hypothetical protein
MHQRFMDKHKLISVKLIMNILKDGANKIGFFLKVFKLITKVWIYWMAKTFLLVLPNDIRYVTIT